MGSSDGAIPTKTTAITLPLPDRDKMKTRLGMPTAVAAAPIRVAMGRAGSVAPLAPPVTIPPSAIAPPLP